MSKPITKKENHSINKKKWLILGVVAAALLLIPRRSSRQDMPVDNLASDDSKKPTDN